MEKLIYALLGVGVIFFFVRAIVLGFRDSKRGYPNRDARGSSGVEVSSTLAGAGHFGDDRGSYEGGRGSDSGDGGGGGGSSDGGGGGGD